MLARTAAASFVLLSLVTAAACGSPGVQVSAVEVPNVMVGPARTLVVTDAYGRRSAVASVQEQALFQISDEGWFRAVDGHFDGSLEVDRDGAFLSDGVMNRGHAYLRLDVLEHSVVYADEAREGVDEFGNGVLVIVPTVTAHVLLSATVASGDGVVRVEFLETDGVAVADEPASELELMALAEFEAVRRVLDEITPRVVNEHIPFDDRDDAQKPIIDRATSGQPQQALALADELLANHPTPAGHYNRGVLLEALRDIDAALVTYDAARAGADAELRTLIDNAVSAAERRRSAAAAVGF
jgi:hypothetical protein